MCPLVTWQHLHLVPFSSDDARRLLSKADVEEVIHEVVLQHLQQIYQQKPEEDVADLEEEVANLEEVVDS